MVKLAYYSITGQTRHFVQKTNINAYEIQDADPLHEMDQPFILLVPAYDDNMMDTVIDFLQYGTNKKQIIGVIGTGNRNFNELYIHTAKDIAKGLNIPVLYDFEFNGTPTDVKNVEEIINNYELK